MGYKLAVLIEKRVLFITGQGVSHLEDFSNIAQEQVAFLDTCASRQGIILSNMENAHLAETNITTIRAVTSKIFMHPNHLLTVTYGMRDRMLLGFLTNVASSLFKQPLKNFATESQAVNFIISQHIDLAESLPQALKEYHLREG